MSITNGIYIHIPFCIQKCYYCDFISYADCEKFHDAYIDALITEMNIYKGASADTVFIGGGTPTILKPVLLDRLLSSVSEKFKLDYNCEFTVEANPKTLTEEKLKIMKNGGVNRLSIGVQSFVDKELKAIGRIHNADEARKTVELAQSLGFDNINIDIMSSLPFQTVQTLEYSLKEAVKLGASHVSCYSLIVEESTPIQRLYDMGVYTYPDEDTDRLMYNTAEEVLKRAGFSRYEISNYAKEGAQCRHNLKYWQGERYIGLGAAAHSFDGNVRRENTHILDEYLQCRFEKERIVLTENDKIEEYMITGLRTVYGIDEKRFYERFGVKIEKIYEKQLAEFIKSGHMEYNNGVYKLTKKGIDVSNSVMCEFLF